MRENKLEINPYQKRLADTLRANSDQIDRAISEIAPSSLWGDDLPSPAIGRMTQELVDTEPGAVIIPMTRQK